ncbi:MAG: hypothetical protein GC149_05175 [Gammaproteobacteria bacterium]|nr:hypothetical protein [Gammaproteobacteria bacterium]
MALPDPQNLPSTAFKPDLDWSQVRETVMMLNLAVAQIVHSLQDGDESITALGDSFTAMVGNIEMARSAASELAESVEQETILSNCAMASAKMQEAIVAFQFYDRLSQRLSHVAKSLSALGTLVGDQARLYNPYEWRGLQEKIKSRYTLETERRMFEAILTGASVEEAMHLLAQAQSPQQDDDIELF